MRTLLIAALIALAIPAVAFADRRGNSQASLEGHVVHSRRGPVMLHRAVPPFKGVHVYQGKR
jgi:hypothetical protein